MVGMDMNIVMQDQFLWSIRPPLTRASTWSACLCKTLKITNTDAYLYLKYKLMTYMYRSTSLHVFIQTHKYKFMWHTYIQSTSSFTFLHDVYTYMYWSTSLHAFTHTHTLTDIHVFEVQVYVAYMYSKYKLICIWGFISLE